MSKRNKKFSLFLAISIICFVHPVFAQISDAQVKAAMMVRFADFIYWPEEEKQTRLDSELVIAILGDTPISSILENNSFGTQHAQNYVRIQRITSVSDMVAPHILFISKEFHNELHPFLQYAKKHKLLTISEFDHIKDRKIMINFFTEDNKIHFEINQNIVRENNFKISSRLLRIARITESK